MNPAKGDQGAEFVKSWPLPDGFWSVRELARALGISRYLVRRRAQVQHWRRRRQGNRDEFCPHGTDLTQAEVAALARTARAAHQQAPPAMLVEPRLMASLRRAVMRQLFAQRYHELRLQRPEIRTHEAARILSDAFDQRWDFLDILGGPPPFTRMSPDRLAFWAERYQRFGFRGCFDHCLDRGRGRSRGPRPPPTNPDPAQETPMKISVIIDTDTPATATSQRSSTAAASCPCGPFKAVNSVLERLNELPTPASPEEAALRNRCLTVAANKRVDPFSRLAALACAGDSANPQSAELLHALEQANANELAAT